MKAPLLLMLSAAFLVSCASPGSIILTGTRRPPVPVASVQVYETAPPNAVTVGIVSAESGGWSEQTKADRVMNAIKARAADAGANGVVLTEVSEPIAGIAANGTIGRRKMVKATAVWVAGP